VGSKTRGGAITDTAEVLSGPECYYRPDVRVLRQDSSFLYFLVKYNKEYIIT